MSLVNPSSRWWNRPRPRKTVAWCCMAVGGLLVFVASWIFSLELEGVASGASVGVGVGTGLLGFALVMVGMFGRALGPGSDDMDAREIGNPIALLFVAMGAGAVAASISVGSAPRVDSVVFLAAGLIAVAVIEVFVRRGSGKRRLEAETLRRGISVESVVTNVWNYNENYLTVTRVTMRFVDREGRQRWHKTTMSGKVTVGERIGLRYLPGSESKRGGVMVMRNWG